MKKKSCTWTQQGEFSDWYSTKCGHEFIINDGSPKENGMRFCLFCGCRLYQKLILI